MTGNKDAPGFASRWSRLKREGEEEPEAAAAEETPAEDERSDAEVLEELGLPDPDSLEPGDSFAAFMAKTVPARIRNRALRRLWVSNPVLANVDMLVDYGEDFTDAATVIENLQTGYEVGKGWMGKYPPKVKEEIAMEERGQEAGADEAGEADADVEGEAPTVVADADTGVPEDNEAAPDAVGAVAAVEPDPAFQPRARMRFRIDDV